MSLVSHGYAAPSGGIASIDTQRWSQISRHLGSDYTVGGPGDFKVTTAAGDRTVQYAAGTAFGRGVLDVGTATANTLQLDAPPSGSRWYIVGLRRDWPNKVTTFASFGYSILAAKSAAVAAALGARTQNPGTGVDDHPLAAVQITAGSTSPTDFVDLRCWKGNGGVVAVEDSVRDYLNTAGTDVTINGVRWFRDIDSGGALSWRSDINAANATLFGFNGLVSGAGNPGASGVLIQAGTKVQSSGPDGYAQIVFPTPFPNALIAPFPVNGDNFVSEATGSLTIAPAGTFLGNGTREHFWYSVLNSAGARRANLSHRVNWFAIGF